MMLCFTFVYGLALVASAFAAQLQEVKESEFGPSPSVMQLYTYVPDKAATNPAIVVAMHPCGGTPQMYHRMAGLSSYADQLGFVLIYPGTRGQGMNCFDNHSAKTLKRDGGSESQTISNMVKWAVKKFNADPKRVFLTGSSSGGIMTDVLAGTYPDLFAAGAPISGTPFGCWAGAQSSTPMTSDKRCMNGQKMFSAKQWGDLAREVYPEYKGKYPRMQIWHGARDPLILAKNLDDQLLQWGDLHGVSFSKNETNNPQNGYTKIVYGDGTKVVGYLSLSGGHIPKVNQEVMLKFFGIL